MPTSTLQAIRNKVRRITGRPSAAQITDAQIDEYVNTFYVYDLPEHIKPESLRMTWQFIAQAGIPVYDMPTGTYLTAMPPVFIAGYQCLMNQSREGWFRMNPQLQFNEANAAIGNNTTGPYNFTLTNTPIVRGYKPNPPGAYSSSIVSDIPASRLNWNVMISGLNNAGVSVALVDDGQGNLFDPGDASTNPAAARGTVNYATGAIAINALGFSSAIAAGSAISAQYVRYNPSRPTSAMFFQDQVTLWPIPDQAYTVSMEVFRLPTDLLNATDTPILNEWWQLLAYGAADKVFADNADFENMSKFRPLLDEQMRLALRRTIVQYSAERTATIYTEQTSFPQYPGMGLTGI